MQKNEDSSALGRFLEVGYHGKEQRRKINLHANRRVSDKHCCLHRQYSNAGMVDIDRAYFVLEKASSSLGLISLL